MQVPKTVQYKYPASLFMLKTAIFINKILNKKLINTSIHLYFQLKSLKCVNTTSSFYEFGETGYNSTKCGSAYKSHHRHTDLELHVQLLNAHHINFSVRMAHIAHNATVLHLIHVFSCHNILVPCQMQTAHTSARKDSRFMHSDKHFLHYIKHIGLL